MTERGLNIRAGEEPRQRIRTRRKGRVMAPMAIQSKRPILSQGNDDNAEGIPGAVAAKERGMVRTAPVFVLPRRQDTAGGPRRAHFLLHKVPKDSHSFTTARSGLVACACDRPRRKASKQSHCLGLDIHLAISRENVPYLGGHLSRP